MFLQINLAKILMKGDHNTTMYQAIYDNSSVFVEYLNKLGVGNYAHSAKLKLKSTHTLVPHVSKPRHSPIKW